ncbi:hypothetical protein MKX01_017009 [Papaver californicum]|nr:hypothetical protein MKX01_017009 [Papaver californicum]
MGLEQTIQSIAFLGSLFEENLYPHLVVAPLSTLLNWEREFATWAPHMNVANFLSLNSVCCSVVQTAEGGGVLVLGEVVEEGIICSPLDAHERVKMSSPVTY